VALLALAACERIAIFNVMSPPNSGGSDEDARRHEAANV
jgi:hypothetical protein